MYGTHCVRHWSSTQPTIALSSGEAELGGLCKGASHAIGLKAICKDMGFERSLLLRTDATAAMGMSRRLGIGEIRHLDTSLLWIQEKVRSGACPIDKVPGAENSADILTKHVDGPLLRFHLAKIGLVAETGRAESAPALTGESAQ